MRRRQFISLLWSAAVALPFAAHAQQQATPAVGIFGVPSPESLAGLRKGLTEQGFVENRNVILDIRTAPGTDYDRLLAIATELTRRPVAVLISGGSARGAQAAMAATSTIPIVFANGSDPVKVGLVASMNRPGGNATGVSFYTSALGPKRLELLRELVPQATPIALLVNPMNPVTEGDIKDMKIAARSVGQHIIVVSASNDSEIEAAFTTIGRERAGALIVNVDAFFFSRRRQLAALAARYRIPASYNNSQHVKVGGLMSYGDNRADSYRLVGVYAGRILKGEKPANLPVMQPTRFELAINLKTAKSLGLSVPPTLLARADEVIE